MVFKRQFFEYLSMMIGVIMNEVWMTNGDKSFIMRGIEGKTEWDMVRYPYKTVYGLPKSLQCSESVYHQFNKCEKSSHREWKVTIDEYFYETKQFCCFVWHTMACEIEIAAKCNRNYSQQIETSTRKSFTSMCDKIGSSQRSWNCLWTEDMISTIGVVVTAITIFLIAVVVYIGCRNNRENAKFKAQGKLAEQMNITSKTTTADTGAPTNVRTLQSNEIPERFEYSSSPSRYSSSSSSSPTQSRYEHSIPQPDNKKQFYRKFAARYSNYETSSSSSSDNSPTTSPPVTKKIKRSIPLETTTTTTTDNQSQQQQSDQISINLVKDPTNTNKNLTNLTNIIVNLDKIDIDPNVKMP
ncbi:uncharacterized protein LOC113796534 [Dermatophagoides pteronyssinus]|uniref:uncharacterized protein LOC113796534 n=1 Tax=Dermatophagoides pteronyssinus TaxID=6956 RepID=UPI003F6815F3